MIYVLKGLFASFMSGNTISLGLALGRGDSAALPILVTFTGGAATGGLLAIAFGRHSLPGVVAFVAGCLALALVSRPASIHRRK